MVKKDKANTEDLWNDFWENKESQSTPSYNDAKYWHELNNAYYLNFWEEKLKVLKPGSKILECGCGSAKFSEFFARKGFECTMMDYSDNAIQSAKINFRNNGLQGKFIVGDVNKIEMPDNSFDLVYSGGLLQHFTNISLPIEEMVRILKPNGIFAATVIPKKFSIQSIVNRLINNPILFLRKIIKKGDVIGSNMEKLSFIFVNSYKLKDYKNELEKDGIYQIYGRCMSPFPYLLITQGGNKFYTKILKHLVPLWKKFDESSNYLTEIFGVSYNIIGKK